jgi:hypothetical protein
MSDGSGHGGHQPHPHMLGKKSPSFAMLGKKSPSFSLPMLGLGGGALGGKSPSFMGFGGTTASAGVKNIAKIKTKRKSSRNLLAEEFHYKPKVSQSFLHDWLDYPVDRHEHTLFNSFYMWFVYLQWTNKGMAGLDPVDSTIRSRVCNQLQVLGTVASLFLVIAVASFLVPPSK